MGLDDMIFDSKLLDKTKENCKDLIGAYDYENWDNLEAMEHLDGATYYNGYSVCFRMIYPIHHVMMAGSIPFPLTSEHLRFLKLQTRLDVLELSIPKQDINENNKRKIIKYMEETKSALEVMRESWRSE